MLKMTKKIKAKEIYQKIKDKNLPFDHLAFFHDNIDLVVKFINKNTLKLVIEGSDQIEVPEEMQYMNNGAVVAAGCEREFTTLQKLEWIKCSIDAVYFCEKYIKIISIDDGIIPFKMYDYQREMVKMFQENRLVCACTGRQQGKCVRGNTKYKVRNKKTGETLYVTAKEFHEKTKN